MIDGHKELERLLKYSGKNGIDILYKEFEQKLDSPYRDTDKDYDENEKIIYFFGDITSPDVDGSLGISDKSSPVHFEEYLETTISGVSGNYLYWLEQMYKNEDSDKVKAVIRHHLDLVNEAYNSYPEINTPLSKALAKVKQKLLTYADYYDLYQDRVTKVKNLTKEDIYEYYFRLLIEEESLNRTDAFLRTKRWLIDELRLSEPEVKKLGVNLKKPNFFRNANNQDDLKHKISSEINNR